MRRRERRLDNVGWLVVGAILVIVGGFYVLQNTFGLNLNWDAVWPFIVVGLGLVFLASALFSRTGEQPGAGQPGTGQPGIGQPGGGPPPA